jgi:Calcineurin-like phosphoesterase
MQMPKTKQPGSNRRRVVGKAIPATKDLKVAGPIFGDAKPEPTSTNFRKPMNDQAHLHGLNLKLLYPIPAPRDGKNVPVSSLVLTLNQVINNQASIAKIQKAGHIVFHSTGDTGPLKGFSNINSVVEAMIADFNEPNSADNPAFFFHLGDVVYSFGEDSSYYDQFYEPYRDYPAPIIAIPGNHDAITWNQKANPSMFGFLRNFCNKPWVRLSEAGSLARTAMIQPSVYFRFDAPFVKILGLYSNASEDPGVISSEGGTNKIVSDVQLSFLQTHLQLLAKQKYSGALIIAVHHPPYCWAQTHSGSPRMLQDIDNACKAAGMFPHAVLSGHAHNYQRFTRADGGRQVPYIVCGCGGYNSVPLSPKSAPPRTPLTFGTVTFDRYFVNNYGYLRIVVSDQILRIEYHDSTLGNTTKSPADAVNVDIASRQLTTALP